MFSLVGIASLLLLNLLASTVHATAIVSRALTYQLDTLFSGQTFFDGFDFFTAADPTDGFVTYVDNSTASSLNLISIANNGAAYMGVDHTTTLSTSGPGRKSVRITSQKSWTHGLFVADLAHMPASVCGTWPALWMLGPDWPNGGEIDIIEGVNTNTQNLMSLHTSPGCTVSGTSQLGTQQTTNCDATINGNTGCSVTVPTTTSYGTGFDSNGGGVYATEWTSDYIRIWFFTHATIPQNLQNGQPDTSTWGEPQANFEGACDIDAKFTDMQIVFDTTFCGSWAGTVWFDGSCGTVDTSGCVDYVAGNPGAFIESYWSVNSVVVYTLGVATATSTSTSTSTSKSSSRSSSVGISTSKSSSTGLSSTSSSHSSAVATSKSTSTTHSTSLSSTKGSSSTVSSKSSSQSSTGSSTVKSSSSTSSSRSGTSISTSRLGSTSSKSSVVSSSSSISSHSSTSSLSSDTTTTTTTTTTATRTRTRSSSEEPSTTTRTTTITRTQSSSSSTQTTVSSSLDPSQSSSTKTSSRLVLSSSTKLTESTSSKTSSSTKQSSSSSQPSSSERTSTSTSVSVASSGQSTSTISGLLSSTTSTSSQVSSSAESTDHSSSTIPTSSTSVTPSSSTQAISTFSIVPNQVVSLSSSSTTHTTSTDSGTSLSSKQTTSTRSELSSSASSSSRLLTSTTSESLLSNQHATPTDSTLSSSTEPPSSLSSSSSSVQRGSTDTSSKISSSMKESNPLSSSSSSARAISTDTSSQISSSTSVSTEHTSSSSSQTSSTSLSSTESTESPIPSQTPISTSTTALTAISPGQPLPTNPAFIPPFTLVGCFSSSLPFFENFALITTSRLMTLQLCVNSCQQHEFAAAFGEECFCGNVNPGTREVGVGEGAEGSGAVCDLRCPGNADQACGGAGDRGVRKREGVPGGVSLTLYQNLEVPFVWPDLAFYLGGGPPGASQASTTVCEEMSSVGGARLETTGSAEVITGLTTGGAEVLPSSGVSMGDGAALTQSQSSTVTEEGVVGTSTSTGSAEGGLTTGSASEISNPTTSPTAEQSSVVDVSPSAASSSQSSPSSTTSEVVVVVETVVPTPGNGIAPDVSNTGGGKGGRELRWSLEGLLGVAVVFWAL